MNLKCFFIVLLFTVQSYGQEKQFIVFFDFNKDVPNESSQNKIDMWVLENKNIEITRVFGYCDSVDDSKYNKDLAMRRVNSVMSFFKSNAVRINEKVELKSFGKDFKYSKNQKRVAIKHKIAGLLEGFWSITKMDKKWAFLAHTLIIWGSYLVMFYVTIFALPETSNLSFNAVIIAFVVGGLAITLTNSGFGAYPFLIANILLFYNIPETAGNAFGWIVWTSQTLMIVILGTLSFLFLPLLNKNK
jgi:hypothetical protein